ncbi:glutaredoxin domain-containing cysteine-rich protein 1 [Trichomycterus rosablanca]|uniref:glutaredoxin domain-containing cysteine-rich protein 1 n=1 Tax=Trichomycterus rosablanca TaxID=2290929 RepID=UPI002F35F20F
MLVMERNMTGREEEGCRPKKRVRFRVASARSGRVLREVYREEEEEEIEDSTDSDTAAGSETEPSRAVSPSVSEANSHLNRLACELHKDNDSDPDDLLVYASTAHEQLFSRKRINIFSKNGTVRGVRDKVSAGQVLFNNLAKVYGGSLHGNRQKRS